jgi:acyl carrier protein
MDHFVERVAEILEVDQLKGSDVLADFAQWDSLSVLSVVAMADACYGADLAALDIQTAGTVQDLWDLVVSRSSR